MIIKTGALFRNLSLNVLSGLKRFPEAILLAVTWASIMIYLNHFSLNDGVIFKRILFVIALGCPVFLCIRVFFERMPLTKRKVKILIYVSAIIGLLAYFLMDMHKDFNMVSIIRYTAFSIFFYLAFTFIPYFYRRENYELYVINLLTRLFVTCLYALILFAGLLIMLVTMDMLFSMHVSHKLDGDLALITIVFAVVFFLAGVPEPEQEFQLENYPKMLKVLFMYIVIPLLTAYSAILYIYFFKIILTMQWPDKMVANLVLWYAMISALVLFCMYPLWDTKEWVHKFLLFFPKVILPLLLMMFISMGIRIYAYGITENRYFVLLTGLGILGYMLYLSFNKQPRNIVIAIFLAIVAILSVWGPWSCFTVSEFSQNLRFEKILKKYDMISNNVVTKPSQTLPDTDKEEIQSIIKYFNNYHKLKDLKYLPQGFEMSQMQNIFGFGSNDPIDYFHHTLKDEIWLDIQDFNYFTEININMSRASNMDFVVDGAFSIANKELNILKKGEVIYSKNIQDIALQLHRNNQGQSSVKQSEMTFTDDNENVKVVYMFKHIGGRDNTVNQAACYLFVKFK